MIATKVFNMESNKGNKIANQFLITTDEAFYFQSYNSIIAKRTNEGKIFLDEKFWDFLINQCSSGLFTYLVAC